MTDHPTPSRRTPAKLAAFAAVLAVLFGGGALAGGAVGPDRDPAPAAAHEAHAEHAMAQPVRGLAVAEHGLRLVVADPELRGDRTERLRFSVVDGSGRAVRDFDVEHTKRLHLIVARRDLTRFQHLHPRMDAAGTWTTPLRLRDAGSYRVFADFSHGGRATTLASDLRVDGDADLEALPDPRPTAVSDDGYHVRLDAGAARAGREAGLRFTIAKDGRPVRTEPYLGAGGHLVALREGDLAYLHVHPTTPAGGDTIAFASTFPTAGAYRLFLQFKHAGRVQTVAFTQAVS